MGTKARAARARTAEPVMDPKTEKMIDSTILHTRRLLASGAVSWPAARIGLLEVMQDLAARYPLAAADIDRRIGAVMREEEKLFRLRRMVRG
jgi:hypothetical protein